MARRRVQPEPKPFFWITLRGKPRPQALPLVFHDRSQGWTGRMELEIEVLSDYLYAGSGEFDLFLLNGEERVRYAFTRHNGQLIIPGTGIKGAVRSIVEAISNSCVLQHTWRERLLGSHRACERVKRGRERQARLCPACRLFGTTGYRGRVHFADATPVGEVQTATIKIADLWPPRRYKGRKFYQTKAFQRQDMRPQKNYRFLEVIPQGTCFRTTMFFENVETAEMGLVMRALGLAFGQEAPDKIVYAFPVKLGGAKPRCLGSVRFHPKAIKIISSSGENPFKALLAGGESLSIRQTLAEWLSDRTLLDEDAWKDFREKAKPQEGKCPKEVY